MTRRLRPAERLERDVRSRLHVGGEIRFTQIKVDGDVATVLVEVGETVTVSFVQADYHQRVFKSKRAFRVRANSMTGALIDVEEAPTCR